jgi:hypothetical protein
MASTAIKLPDELINEARRYGEVYSRSVPKQIEYWSRIGRLAEENPELSYSFLKEILLSVNEAASGELSPYQFG